MNAESGSTTVIDSGLIGQTLDEKYRIERQLGKGGMGTVYLATHLGTERPVAVKVIAPQFMERPEFVERFRREARAAGRLRHPNVVDVTDFGICNTCAGRVAYLVMEYLDGCTLGEILDEEKNLPVSWTLDILDQVCSAVHEAHLQGIIHRDLKPDNIWLEPNQRGGYTVKVLDFGIAKLEDNVFSDNGETQLPSSTENGSHGLQTVSNLSDRTAIHDSVSPTMISEVNTLVQLVPELPELPSDPDEKATAIIVESTVHGDNDLDLQDSVSTKLISSASGSGPADANASDTEDENASRSTNALTRVGAVLGTPLYMSPEQCRGQKLDARSDVYSLGVIAYQMLSGRTPFEGEFTRVMDAHRETPPPPLKARKVRKKLKRVIMSALSKDPSQRPQSAEALATILRSRSEGIFGLLRRAGMIYTEHITKFLGLSALFHVPMITLTAILVSASILRAMDQISESDLSLIASSVGTLLFFATAFGAYLIIGTTTWIVSQSLAVPLRPIRLRTALKASAKKWKRFAGTGVLTTMVQIIFGVAATFLIAGILVGIGILIFGASGATIPAAIGLGVFLGICTFLLTCVLTTLVGPVVMMESLKGIAAIKRSIQLVRRSLVTSIGAVVIMFLIPAVVAGLVSAAVNLSVRGIENSAQAAKSTAGKSNSDDAGVEGGEPRDRSVSVSSGGGVRFMDLDPEMRKRVRVAISDTLLQLFLLPLQILMTSFTAIIVALLYLKSRQSGGEQLQDLLSNFEDAEQPRKKWQERVRERLIQSGRISSSTR